METKSVCATVSEKESVTNLTGMPSSSSSRGDFGVGGKMDRTIKSYNGCSCSVNAPGKS